MSALPAPPRRADHRRSVSALGRLGGWGVAAGLLIAVVGPAEAIAAAPAAPANVGLFGAQDPKFDGVYRQSLSIIGLVATGHRPDANAIDWLLAQQCADGAFTAYRANTATPCAPAGEDENATAAAIQAEATLGKPTANAITALRRFQLADGGFYDNTAFGPAASDVNSTGLALSAFVAAGIDPATVTSSDGKTGDQYLRSLQIGCEATSGAGAYDFQAEATLHANDYATVQGLLGALGKALPISATSAGGTAPACPAAVSDAATSAAAATSYLAARLAATSGAIPSAFGSGVDWTTTANAVLDLQAAGAGASAVSAALATLEANVKPYTQVAGIDVAGPLATLLLVAHASGADPAGFGGVDLAQALSATERIAAASLPATGSGGLAPLGSLATALIGIGVAALMVSRRRSGIQQG
jgi:hypothetical protein